MNKIDKILDRFEKTHRKLAAEAVKAAVQHEAKPTRGTEVRLEVLRGQARLLLLRFKDQFGFLPSWPRGR